METVPAGVTVLDRNGGVIYANRQAVKILGLARDKITNLYYNSPEWGVCDFEGNTFPDDELPFEIVKKTKQPVFNVRRAIIHPGGARVLLSINATPLINEKGEFEGVVASLNDVTDRIKMEESLRKNENFLADVFESIQEGVCVLHKNLDIIRVNNVMNQWYRAEAPLEGKKCYAAYHRRERPCDVCPTLRCIESGDTESDVVPGLPGSGVEWVELFIYPMKDRDRGEIVGVVEFVRNITEKIKEKRLFEESEKRYRDIFDNAILGIFQSAPEGRYIDLNPAMAKIYGYDSPDEMKKSVNDIGYDLYVNPEEREQVRRSLETVGEVRNIEVEQYRKDNQKIWISFNARRVCDASSAILYFEGTAEDITERKMVEKKLEEKTSELESLFSISAELRSARNIDEMLPLVLREMRHALNSDAGEVILIDPDGERLKVAIADGALASERGRAFDIGEGVWGKVLQSGKPALIPDFADETSQCSNIKRVKELRPAILAPIQSDVASLGLLIAAREKTPRSSDFTPMDLRLLKALGEMLGNAIQRTRLHNETLNHLQYMKALHSIDMAITASMDLRVVLNVLLSKVNHSLELDAAAILLLNSDTLSLEYEAVIGFHTKTYSSLVLRMGEGLSGRIALERRSVHLKNLNDMDHNPDYHTLLKQEKFIFYYGVPLIAKGRVIGVLETYNRAPLVISDEWINFLETLASQAAIAIDNTRMFYDLQRSNIDLSLAYDTTLEGWSRALDLRDKETEGHTRRVAELTLRMSRAEGVAQSQIVHIRRGALLHDIGKMAVPDSILLKPGKLTDDEWTIMRMHPKYAFDLLYPIEYLRPSLDIPYCHHEKWDGGGYPRGLEGESIPFSARIFAIVDVWDALITKSPYRSAWAPRKAFDYILEQSGKHFDPRFVDIFSNIIKQEELLGL